MGWAGLVGTIFLISLYVHQKTAEEFLIVERDYHEACTCIKIENYFLIVTV